MVCHRHCILTTKVWERQIDPLSVADFEAVLIAMTSMNAFAFYNCGEKSGAS